jgi:two-component system KDP operon response regulator KdpE
MGGASMTAVKPSVLVIDDEKRMRRFVRASLGRTGYHVIEASNAADGLRHAQTASPDVVLVDLDLPDIDGFEFTRRVRRSSPVPILVMSARTDELSTVRALDVGADDYLTQPIRAGELGARVRVALRHGTRTTEAPSGTLAIGKRVRVDLVRRVVRVEGEEVHLTPLEYDFLAVLVKNANQVLSHQSLLEQIWGPEHTQQLEYLRVYMKALRLKLEQNPTKPQHLLTELGVGYRLRLS